MAQTTMINGATADVTSSAVDYTASTTIVVKGRMGAKAKVIIEISDDAGTSWEPGDGLDFETTGVRNLILYGTFKFRARLLNSSASTLITVTENTA